MEMKYKLCSMILMLSCCLTVNALHHESQQERLDSIIMYDYRSKKKCEFLYNVQGQVEQILYYRWADGGWSITNRREYLYDGQGNDTLRLIFHRKDGLWLLEEQRYSSYDVYGKRLQERTVSYVDSKDPTQSRWDFLYDEYGRRVSATKYREEKGAWRKAMTVQDEYDAEGNYVKEVYEDMNTNYSSRGCTIMRYDENKRITIQIDSVYNSLSGREWRRREFSYNNQGLSMVKETLKTIDHDEAQQSLDEFLFDPQSNLLQTERYRYDRGAWQHVCSVSYVYDLNRDASSIRGSEFLLDVLGIEINEQIHHKLLRKFNVEMGEEGDVYETRCYYSEVLPV